MPPRNKKYGAKWKARAGEAEEDLTVPSGELCRVRRPGAEGLLRAGVLKQADFLTPEASKAIGRAQGKEMSEAQIAAQVQKMISEDEDGLDKLMGFIDKIVVYCVVEPKILPSPAIDATRDPENVYADDIDLDDKMFIVNFAVGGTRDLATFREQSDRALAGVATVASDAVSTK